MSLFFFFLHFFFAGQGFAHVLGLGAWLFPRVTALFRWEPQEQPVDVGADVDADVDVDAEVDAGGRRRRRRGGCLCYTPAGTDKGANIKHNIKQ